MEYCFVVGTHRMQQKCIKVERVRAPQTEGKTEKARLSRLRIFLYRRYFLSLLKMLRVCIRSNPVFFPLFLVKRIMQLDIFLFSF